MIWNALDFISGRIARLRPAIALGMKTVEVSGLEGLEDAIANMIDARAICAVADTSDGDLDLETAPGANSFKLIFLMLRVPEGDMAARKEALAKLQIIFQALLSAIIPERTRLENDLIFIDRRIQYHEAPAPLLTGYACLWFQIRVNQPVDLSLNPALWL